MRARISSKTQIGNATEAAVALVLMRLGFDVYTPVFGGGRCDLIVRDSGRLRTVQCKTGRLYKGAIQIQTMSKQREKYVPRSYRGEIDDFGVYCPANGAVYLVPVDDLPEVNASLRLETPRNNQVQGIRWAHEYEVGRVQESLVLVDPTSVSVDGDIWSFPADGRDKE